jgi:hypothetical protein
VVVILAKPAKSHAIRRNFNWKIKDISDNENRSGENS